MTLLNKLQGLAQRPDIGLDLSVYKSETLAEIVAAIEGYLERARRPSNRGSWLSWLRSGGTGEQERVPPLLLSGPVGTGKTTLMMLLDRALPEASCASLFQQEIWAHSSSAGDDGVRESVEVRPLALMGHSRTVSTGVIRLSELQAFYRLYTYDRRVHRLDKAAAEHFAKLFKGKVVFIDEFVPDNVTSFPMQVINHLADRGVLVVLSSNRRETPFVEGVQVIPVEGDDMRVGELLLVCRPAKPDPRFDSFEDVAPAPFHHVARGLKGRVREQDGMRWMYLCWPEVARVAADQLAFRYLLQFTDGVLIDEVPFFDPERGGSLDAARRFVYLVDALYDERRPVILRLTSEQPLSNDFDVDTLRELYTPETIVDLERALSRLRQLSTLLTLKITD